MQCLRLLGLGIAGIQLQTVCTKRKEIILALRVHIENEQGRIDLQSNMTGCLQKTPIVRGSKQICIFLKTNGRIFTSL